MASRRLWNLFGHRYKLSVYRFSDHHIALACKFFSGIGYYGPVLEPISTLLHQGNHPMKKFKWIATLAATAAVIIISCKTEFETTKAD